MKNPGLVIAASLLALALTGCAGTPTLDLGQPGKSLTYVPGSPSFDFEAIPVDGEGRVQLSISIPASSLTFLKSPSGFEARLDIAVQAFAQRADTLIQDYAWLDTIAVQTYDETQREDSWVLTRSFRFVPGDVDLRVEVRDEATGKHETRVQRLRIPSANEQHPFIGRIVLQARSHETWATIVPLHIPASLPGFRASARIFGLHAGEQGTALISLLRFKLANTVAQPPYYFSDFLPTPGEPKAIWFDSPDTVRSQRDSVRMIAGKRPELKFDLGRLRPALYRIAVAVTLPSRTGEGDTTLVGSRVFSIKPPTFPKPTTLREMLDAMTYILNPKERRLCEETRSPKAEQRLFDSLWLSFRPTKEQAAALLKRYFSRVEEANRLYTDFKEGWKTDRGMLYIVFGPPRDIMNSLDRQIWTYEVPGTSQEVQFIFRRIIVGQGDLSMQGYALYRDASYEWVWESMVGKWRYGGGGW